MKIIKLAGLNAVSIVKEENERIFISTKDSVIISIPALAFLIKFLVQNSFMSRKVLEGILSELSE